MGKHHKQDEIYKIVMDCRTSGLSDFQWCKANGVNPSSLYRWVQKLKSTGYDIPDKVKGSVIKSLPQEVVKLEVSPTDNQHTIATERNTPIPTTFANRLVPVMEITGGVKNSLNIYLLK